MDLISVVLCCHNGERTLVDQLSALAEQRYDGKWEVVFVDDGSTDSSVSIAESWSDRLPLRIVPTSESGEPGRDLRALGTSAATPPRASVCSCSATTTTWPTRAGSPRSREPRREPRRSADATRRRLLERSARPRLALPVDSGSPADRLRTGLRFRVGNNSGVWTDGVPGGRRVRPRSSPSSAPARRLTSSGAFSWPGTTCSYVPNAIMHVRHRNSLKTLVSQAYRYGLGERRALPALQPSRPAPDTPVAERSASLAQDRAAASPRRSSAGGDGAHGCG